MPRGRPELYPIKKLIRFDQKMLDDIDEWRRHQTPIPTVTDAMRALIKLGLAAGTTEVHTSKPTAGPKMARPKKARPRRS